MTPWRRLVGDRPIVTRLVLAVAGTMTVVLVAAAGFVFWRVEYALNRQLDEDLKAYQEVVEAAVATDAAPPADTPGQSYQVYDRRGRVLAGNAITRLVPPATVSEAAKGREQHADVGNLYPPARHPYRVVTAPLQTSRGPVVVAFAISKRKHDEALRELLLQLAIADLVTLAAASLVGYGTARAALNPVERYRLAAENANGTPLLPVDAGKDDEVTRLGHTFNSLLDRIGKANQRERQFLADASHELRSPLALMRTELEVALLKPRSETQTREAFESLAAQVERLITLSNALLDLEELRGSGSPVLEPVDVDQLVDVVSDRFAAQAAGEGRRIAGQAHTGLCIEGNRHWLELALGNLVSNGLRYGRGTVSVSATAAASRIQLSVEDEGAGFPDDFTDKAFDRFTRAETSRSTRGTGLGLAIVQAVAEAHSGRSLINGSRVTLDLPAHERPEPPDRHA